MIGQSKALRLIPLWLARVAIVVFIAILVVTVRHEGWLNTLTHIYAIPLGVLMVWPYLLLGLAFGAVVWVACRLAVWQRWLGMAVLVLLFTIPITLFFTSYGPGVMKTTTFMVAFVLLLLALIAALLDMGTVLAGRTPTLLPRPVPGQLHWRAKSNLD